MRLFKVTLGAGQSTYLDVGASRVVYCQASSLPHFEVAVAGRPPIAFKSARKYTHDNGVFNQIQVVNPNGAALSVELVIGDGQIEDRDVQVTGGVEINTPSGLVSYPDEAVGAGVTDLIAAANPARKTLIVANLAANTAVFRIGDADTDAAQGIELEPGASIALQTQAAVYAYNPDVAPQSVALLEVTA